MEVSMAIDESGIASQALLEIIQLKATIEQLLRRENSNPWSQPATYVPLVSIIGAFIVGYWTLKTSIRNTKDNIQASKENLDRQIEHARKVAIITSHERLIAEKRIAWIEELRRASASYYRSVTALSHQITEDISRLQYGGGQASTSFSSELEQIAERKFYLHSMLNPFEEQHQLLASQIEDFYSVQTDRYQAAKSYKIDSDFENGSKIYNQKFTECRDRLLVTLTQILKKEWERIKTPPLEN